ncbi:uncharacterized protein LOC113216320 [Frankliniella occidentalis]|uniref:Uncharacterized protein LOC113216320 n=1 Tax=Frankliniella occidentalis TaxID=133901 RepID=A0A6J1TF08_FRAOC|nr:uncharacterized protein LOC113216320 [Frankliniella occidentalis]
MATPTGLFLLPQTPQTPQKRNNQLSTRTPIAASSRMPAQPKLQILTTPGSARSKIMASWSSSSVQTPQLNSRVKDTSLQARYEKGMLQGLKVMELKAFLSGKIKRVSGLNKTQLCEEVEKYYVSFDSA